MKKWVMTGVMSVFGLGAVAQSTEHTHWYGDAIVRFEQEQNHLSLPDRKRVRAVLRAGVKHQLSEAWWMDAGISTGLKNKQNVPAITVKRINSQPLPESEWYIRRLYVVGEFDNLTLAVGKIPWRLRHTSHVFWDRDLHPLGIHLDYRVSNDGLLQFAALKPLDGNAATVGQMAVLQYEQKFHLNGITLTLSPWFVDYQGEQGAQFATRDTELDNQFVRMSTAVAYGDLQLGLDLGHSLKTFSEAEFGEFADQTDSLSLSFKYGTLNKQGDYLAQFSYLHVERFAVVSEFGQNGTARFATSDYQGIDALLRRQMGQNWWLGMRFSDMERLKGEPEEGIRFRLEARYEF